MLCSKFCKVAIRQQALTKSMSRMATNQALMTQFAARTFASFETIEKASQKLNKALTSEIKYENDNYTQLEDIQTFLDESGFTFHETEDGLKMSLTKEVGDKVVEVQFEAR